MERLGLYEQKQRQRWSDEDGTQFLDERKQAKLQLVQDPSQSNVDNPNNVRRKDSRHFSNKRMEYFEGKIN